ncbi:hypothetical protein [Mycobacterium sp. PSTR-4-N]|uniref:hypothetical protein n=1 Tax=Mycobacterium sp. PSTR-4-N TaxID=2917745 RepID=UPI001F1542F9|nr:hypothetical protein [Mycobacterium sp. PSTR-4-N]MCG7595496.1 hypothetical protein [Mycobacterium sp. PSTR-4-N]
MPDTSRRLCYGVAALVLCAGLAASPAPAWADSGQTETTTVTHSSDSAATTRPDRAGASGNDDSSGRPERPSWKRFAERVQEKMEQRQADREARRDERIEARVGKRARTATQPAPEVVTDTATETTRPTRHLTIVRSESPPAAAVATEPAVAAVTELTVAPGAPVPQPLSPLGKLVQLPGRLINTVLQVLDITSSTSGPQPPVKIIPPINDLLFAVFRETEKWFRLDRTPPPQPAIPEVTYDGPPTGATPTVAQFLNASASAYGLGTTPEGLVPFTVNGFQLASANILSGMAARAWVTADGQIVIAYQGTTGGTNLLFNPLIAGAQLFTDLQVVFTSKTPRAFHDALRFAERVRAAAESQGYDADDIFVTGHSLGGWEAQYVAQQLGLPGVSFEAPGMNTTVEGNGRDSMFVNIITYGDPAGFMATDLPGLQPLMPPYVPGGGSKPHYGNIVLIGDPNAMTPLLNAATLWHTGPIRNLVFLADFFGNFFQYHLPGVQAYHLGVTPDPGVVPWLGTARGPVNTGWGQLTIPELLTVVSGNAQATLVAA